MKRKITQLAVFVVVLSAVMSSCNSNGNNGTATSETSSSTPPTTTSTQSTANEEPKPENIVLRTTMGPGELFPEQIETYKVSNPHVTIEIVSADNTKLMSMIAAGTAPDMLRIMAVQDLPAYITRGIASPRVQEFMDMDIAGAFITDEDDFLPVVDNYRWNEQEKRQGDGTLYGFVKDFSNDQGLIINKKLFKDAGFEIPDYKVPLTYTRLGEMCKKFSVIENGAAERYGMTFWDSDLLSIWRILVYNAQAGESPWSEDFSKADFTNTATMKYIDWSIDLIKDGASVCSVIMQPPNGDYLGAFIDGRVAIANAGYWYTGTLRSNEKTKDSLDNYLCLPTPQIEGREYVSFTTAATGGVMLKATKYPEETYKFMDYFFGGPPASDRAKSGWGLPMFKSMLDLLPEDTEFDKIAKEVAISESEAMTEVLKVNPYIAPTTMTNLLAKYLVPCYTGDDTAANAVKKINDELQPLIAEGMEVVGN